MQRRKHAVAASEVEASTGAVDVSSGWSGGGGSVEVSVDGGTANPVCRVPSHGDLVHVDMQGPSPTGVDTKARGAVRSQRGATGGRVVAEVLPYDALPERTGGAPGLTPVLGGQEGTGGSPGPNLRSSVTALAPVGPRGQSGPARASYTLVEPWHGPASA